MQRVGVYNSIMAESPGKNQTDLQIRKSAKCEGGIRKMEQSLEKRFQTVRRRIEGLRPRLRFETTYFMPLEEELGCVPVNPWHTRIMSELDFCLQMKAYAGTEVTGPVDAALRVLEEAYQKDGVLTDGACEQAEQCLMPLAEESHTYKLIVVGHAHLDMNWKWG